ncbi:MAG TPA: hypothetical protein VL689_15015 [Paraburkholderia sp.]|jgi:hypothetical protein|nr:hypothetical protein [Paraburkholderia sp.]
MHPRTLVAALAVAAVAAASVAGLSGCGETPAPPVPLRAVPAGRIVEPAHTQPGEGLVAVNVRRERASDLIVRFRSAQLYVDGERVADLMNGEYLDLYLSAGVHRIGVSTQFDPVVELPFAVDPRVTNRASVAFDADHRITLRRVAR